MKTNMSASLSAQEPLHAPYQPYASIRTRVPLPHAQVDRANPADAIQPVSPGIVGLRETSFPIDGMRDLHLSGAEPRYFPGVVSRNHRRDSLAKERNSFSEKDDPNWFSAKP